MSILLLRLCDLKPLIKPRKKILVLYAKIAQKCGESDLNSISNLIHNLITNKIYCKVSLNKEYFGSYKISLILVLL